MLLCLVAVLVLGGTFASNELLWRPSGSSQGVQIDPEVYMDSTELITSKGYPCENHYVTTQDGFILNMQRIPHGLKPDPQPAAEKPVIILQHGLESTSSNWLDNLANESLAYLLADAGADVWLGNVRGNVYSTNHTSLTPDQREFWAWSWDEMAEFDLPAMVDHAVRTTGVKQIHYLGHSQGTMMGFAGFSSNHTLASMVKRFYALAPVAKFHDIEGPMRLLGPLARDLKIAFELFGYYDFTPYNKSLMAIVSKECAIAAVDILCENLLFVLGGFDRTHLNQTRIPVYIGHNPGGTSSQNILHFAQGVNVDAFQKFDYGTADANMAHYSQPTAPQYNLSNFHVPVVTYTGGKDFLADPTDVKWLLAQISSSLLANNNIPSWEHLDFIWAYDAPKYCYNDVLNWVIHK